MPKPPGDIKPLIRYFVELFKLQVTGKNNAPDAVRVIPVVEKASGESIYEFRIRYRSAWKTRRVSIEPLGEKVESKSTCYKAIYDDLLVVKIPPRPITDFNAYLNYLNRDRAIARRIQKSIPCVYPELGAILKKVPLVRLPSYISEQEAEEEFIRLLTKFPQLQDYLKIGEGFVFFMTLSRYRFFNQIIDSIHHAIDHTRQEISRNGPEAISDFMVFEALYGEDNDRVYYNMHAIAKTYDRSVEKILKDAGAPWSLADYQKQEWFFSHIAGMHPDIDPEDLPDGTFTRIEKMTKKLVDEKKPAIDEFRRIVHKASKNKNFFSNRGRIKGLIINLLELLYRLKNRSTAVRDLKPDNMYVAAFLDGADHILANPSAYELGLIDLETALCYRPGEDGRIAQPLLAGTPSYATPSHIFGNRILRAVYGNELSRVFHLQDMYAVLAMIFKTVTGRNLFTNTARLMPEISRLKKKNIQDFPGLLTVYKNACKNFWKTASGELREQLDKHRHRLSDVEITLPGHLKKYLAAEYRHELSVLNHNGRNNGEPVEKIRGESREDKALQKQYIKTLKAIDTAMPCDYLILFLFSRVHTAMQPPRPGPGSRPDAESAGETQMIAAMKKE